VSFNPLSLSDDEATGVFARLRLYIEDITNNQPLRNILDHISEDKKREELCKKLGMELINSFHFWIPEIAPLREGNTMIPERTVFFGRGEIK